MNKRNSVIRWICRLLQVILGVTFVYASLDKIVNPHQFAQAVYNYRILPDEAVNLWALILPWLEMFTGLCLLLGVFRLPALFVANSLLLIFLAAVSFNLARGLDIHCGCFSTSASAKSDLAATLWRDLGLLAAGLTALLLSWRGHKSSGLPGPTLT